jgi:hypothetical protein
MNRHVPPPDYLDPQFWNSDAETGWKLLVSERLRAYWPSLPDEFKAEVAAFAQQAWDARERDA